MKTYTMRQRIRLITAVTGLALGACALLLSTPAAQAQLDEKEQGRRPIPDEKKEAPGPDLQRAAEQRTRSVIPDDLEYMTDVVYATVETDRGEPIDLLMDVMYARDNDDQPMPVVVYLHGGGWRDGSKDDATPLLIPIARGGYLAVAVNYRLADVAPYPAAVHDCKAAIRFLRANTAELGIDPDRIGAFGHSAGGQLAAYLAVTGKDADLQGEVGTAEASAAVQCAVTISGPSDFEKLHSRHPELVSTYLAGPADTLSERMLEASTITHVDNEDPPMLIVHGDADKVVPIEHSIWLRDAYEQAGAPVQYLEVKDAGHMIQQRSVYLKVAAFFDHHLGGSARKTLASPVPEHVLEPEESGRRPIPEQPKSPPAPGPDGVGKPKSQPDTQPDDEPVDEPVARLEDTPSDELSKTAIPSGLATPEGAACDLARAFINVDWVLFDKVCLDARGDQYTAFLKQMKRQFELQSDADTPSPFGPRRIARVYEARHLSKNGPTSAAYAIYRFDDLQFVDVVAELHDGSESLVRTLVVRKDGQWQVIPDPSSFPLLSDGLNDESESTELYGSAD